MSKLKVGITMGDINGIGPEVIIKALANPKMREMCVPVIYGSTKALSYHKNIVKNIDFSFVSVSSAERSVKHKVNVVNCWDESVNITLGKVSEEGGKYAYIALDRAVNELKAGALDALVTAPIHKKAMQSAQFPYPGHTEFLTDRDGQSDSLMIMVSDTMRIAVVSGHVALREVSDRVQRETVEKKLQLFHRALQRDFGLERPSIAVLGLNPHAGDDGLIGNEEEEIIRPVIIESKKKGIMVMGPYSADGFFGNGTYRKFDGILAMYHDQGLIPFKTISFGNGVNYTAGLSFVRTSPDHGVGFDITGNNQADPRSMRQAIYQALDIVRNRKIHGVEGANPMQKKPKPSEEVNEKKT